MVLIINSYAQNYKYEENLEHYGPKKESGTYTIYSRAISTQGRPSIK